MYSVRFTRAAVSDLERLPAFHRRRVLAQIRRELTTDPASPGRRKKLIVGELGSTRQLRVGEFRVFYDVAPNEAAVLVWGIRRKGRRTTGEVL